MSAQPVGHGSPWAAGAPSIGGRAWRRLAGSVTVLLLGATIALGLAGAAPAVADALSREPPAAQRGIARRLRQLGHAVGRPEPGAHPAFAPGSQPIGAGARPHRSFADDLFGSPEGEMLRRQDELRRKAEAIERSSVGHGVAVARSTLQLLAAPSERAEVVGAVAPGEIVVLLDERGAWAQVVRAGTIDAVSGWVPASELERVR